MPTKLRKKTQACNPPQQNKLKHIQTMIHMIQGRENCNSRIDQSVSEQELLLAQKGSAS
jgi:hypothetical protein